MDSTKDSFENSHDEYIFLGVTRTWNPLAAVVQTEFLGLGHITHFIACKSKLALFKAHFGTAHIYCAGTSFNTP